MSISDIRCNIKDCSSNAKSFRRGYCPSHYIIFLSQNNFITNKERKMRRPPIIKGKIAKIPLGVNAKDGYAIVDKDMAYIANSHKWQKHLGYAYSNINNKMTAMHHVILGKPISPLVTDHINRNRLDNRRDNLRHVTSSENAINKGKDPKNKTGHKNIHWNKQLLKWTVQITRNHITYCVGSFINIEDAISARDSRLRDLI